MIRWKPECVAYEAIERVMRVYDTIMINMFKRYFAPKRQQLAISLQMGDERVVTHMD